MKLGNANSFSYGSLRPLISTNKEHREWESADKRKGERVGTNWDPSALLGIVGKLKEKRLQR